MTVEVVVVFDHGASVESTKSYHIEYTFGDGLRTDGLCHHNAYISHAR
jgi:hypothetical protein